MVACLIVVLFGKSLDQIANRATAPPIPTPTCTALSFGHNHRQVVDVRLSVLSSAEEASTCTKEANAQLPKVSLPALNLRAQIQIMYTMPLHDGRAAQVCRAGSTAVQLQVILFRSRHPPLAIMVPLRSLVTRAGSSHSISITWSGSRQSCKPLCSDWNKAS